MLADPSVARERAARLREAMLTTRTPAAYRAAVEMLLAASVST